MLEPDANLFEKYTIAVIVTLISTGRAPLQDAFLGPCRLWTIQYGSATEQR